MKMAKATQADLDMAVSLANAFESLTCRWEPALPEEMQKASESEDQDANIELFDDNDDKQCGRVLRHLLDIVNRGSLFRVVWGMLVLLDPANRCVDSNAATIEHHPDANAGLEAKNACPAEEYHEDMGNVLWWLFPIDEPPYVGMPIDDDWPGYHTHFTRLICPDEPQPTPTPPQ
jgi:hypothetical protein